MGWDQDSANDRRPGPAVSDQRVQEVIGAVLARVDSVPRVAPSRPARHSGLNLPPLLASASRFVMPMAAAALLAIVVGHQLQAEENAAQIGTLMSISTLYGSGY